MSGHEKKIEVSAELEVRLADEMERELERTGESESDFLIEALCNELKRRMDKRLEEFYESLDDEHQREIVEEGLAEWEENLPPYEWVEQPDISSA